MNADTEIKNDPETEADHFVTRRNLLLKDEDPVIVRKAWFTLSHLLLNEDAHVVDMGCQDGAMTYAMATLYPKCHFTGLDKSKRQINKAKEKYKLPNLTYKVGDATSEIFEEESLDAIVNSYVLHEVFSGSRYNEQIVNDALRKQFKMLKKGGTMFIRDYARPPQGQFILLEMPDNESTGKELSELSEADLLIWYAEHARPRQDPGCGGFFLEELPERYPGTRLFRLPYKWAYEFIMRKDNRKHWETQLPVEYTFFTEQDFRTSLGRLGARVQYSAPYWDEDIIAERFDGHFRIYADDGSPMGHPPTCFVAVSYKMAERKSLKIEERRPSNTEDSTLKITAMRNQKTGEITDIVSRDLHVSEVLPYRTDSHGYLKVYLHDGLTRSIANAVPRGGGANIDGRRWSGHLIEAISVDGEAISTMEAFDVKHSTLFARDYLGLKPQNDEILKHGPDYYPAPDYIDEKIHTYYLCVQKAKGAITPKSHAGHSEKFQAKGVIREFDAQQVLDAITVGMIPNARLELQILSLFQHLRLRPENWTSKSIDLKLNKLANPSNAQDLLKAMSEPDERFKAVKGTTGELRSIHSTFVEEGRSRGGVAGLSAESIDFIVHDDKTINTAVILPLTKDLKENIHAGVNIKHLPIPQRHENNGLTATVPSLDIPPEVRNNKQLKKFIADEYGITPASVFKMGESYFSHVGITPQRIYPYAIAAPPEMLKDPDNHFIPFYQMMLLQRMLIKEPHLMTTVARSYRFFHDELKLDAKMDVKQILKKRFENLQPDWSLPVHYETMDMLKDHIDARLQERLQEQQLEEKQHLDEEERLRQQLEEQEADTKKKRTKENDDKKKKKKKKKKKITFKTPEQFKPKEGSAHLMNEFEHELDAFLDEVKEEITAKPIPEKW